jgi:hypothetical protein
MREGRTYQGTWPAFTYTLQAVTGNDAPARFPDSVSGYARVNEYQTTATIGPGRSFTTIGSVPVRTASYDECRQRRFFIRWQAVDPSVNAEATFVDEKATIVQNQPVRGNGGWQSSYGCVQPAIRLTPSTVARMSQATVVAQVEVWRRR